MNPKVSIICITFNHEKYIARAIEGFLMQDTSFDYEVLIHDDASSDSTPRIVKRFEQENSGLIKGIYQKENQYSKGVKITGDVVLPLTRGEYIAICEGDDYWTDKDKLQIQIDYMDRHKDCSMTFHLADEVSVIDGRIRKGAPFVLSGRCDINRFAKRRSIIETCTIVARKDLLVPLPLYYYRASIGDLPIELHLLSKGYGYYIHKNMATHLYMVPGSWSARHANEDTSAYIRTVEERIKMYEEFDRETEYRHHKMAETEIFRYRYLVAMRKGNIEEARRLRKAFKTNFKSELLDRIRLRSPVVYETMIKLRQSFRRHSKLWH